MNLLREILRRRLVPVLLTYGALAWCVHTFVNRVLPAYGFPEALTRASGFVALLGLIPVVALAWRFRVTSQGLQRDLRPSVEPVAPHLLSRWQSGFVAVAALVSAIAVTLFLQAPRLDLYPVLSLPQNSLAVLPFAESGSATDEALLASGITDSLLYSAGQLPGIKVSGRDSVHAIGSRNLAMTEAASLLAVKAILTGSVRRSDDRVQIQARLVDGKTGANLWIQDFDREAGQIFAIQDEISASVASALKVQFAPDAPRVATTGTRNLGALEAYWRGIYRFQEKTRASLDGALGQFELAARLDPEFAEAEAQIARTKLNLMMWLGVGDPVRVIGEVERHLDSAQRRNPRLVEVHETRAELLALKGPAMRLPNWYGEAQLALARALRINPNRSSTYAIGAHVAYRHRDFGDVSRAFERALQIDPVAPGLRVDYARSLNALQRTAEAEAQLQQAMTLDPGYADTYYAAAEFYGSSGSRLDHSARHALHARQLDPASPLYAMMLINALTDLGEFDRATQTALESRAVGESNTFWVRAVVRLQALRHDWQAARETLQRFESLSAANLTDSMRQFESHVLATGGEPAAVRALLQRARTQWPGLFAESPRIGSDEESIVFPEVLKLAAMAQERQLVDRLGKMIGGMLPKKPSPAELLTVSGDASLINIYTLLGDSQTAWTLLKTSIGDPPRPTSGWGILKEPELNPVTRALQDDPEFQRWMRDLEAGVRAQREAFLADEKIPGQMQPG